VPKTSTVLFEVFEEASYQEKSSFYEFYTREYDYTSLTKQAKKG
jgi:hypothetical protein